MKYFSTSGPNKGDFTSFIVELRSDASETGQYENNATLTYGDSGSEAAPGSAHFTVISGGVEVKDGKAVLKKVDAGNPDATLPGAVFRLEKMQPDNTWRRLRVRAADYGWKRADHGDGLLLGQ